MRYVYGCVALFAGLVYWMLFGEPSYEVTEIARFAIDGSDALSRDLSRVDATFDPQVSSDADGSLRIDAPDRLFVELATVEGGGQDLSFRELLYEAKLKTEDVTGPVFLVMDAGIHGGMPVVGRENALTGTHDWTTLRVAAGNPQDTRLDYPTTLQLEIGGSGTVWIDDVRLVARRAR
ncbi:MAG: hypothetical protein ACQGVC_19005 [Myxococcota bacterium]